MMESVVISKCHFHGHKIKSILTLPENIVVWSQSVKYNYSANYSQKSMGMWYVYESHRW